MADSPFFIDPNLYQDIADEGPLGVVIKSTIYLENQLLALFGQCFHDVKAIEALRLDYSQKVGLAIACGLDPRFEPPLNALGNIRNKFAHTLGAKIEAAEAEAFHATFTGPDRDQVHQTYERMRKRALEDGKKLPKMKQMDPLDRCACWRSRCIRSSSPRASTRRTTRRSGRHGRARPRP